MEIRQLQQFLAVAEEGSVTAAARRLHMAQSPLSRAIRVLERELGTPLLDRSARRLELTRPGSSCRRNPRSTGPAVSCPGPSPRLPPDPTTGDTGISRRPATRLAARRIRSAGQG